MEVASVLNLVSIITNNVFFSTCVSVFTGVFTFVALSFYFEACIFNIVFLKYLFLIVHKRKYCDIAQGCTHLWCILYIHTLGERERNR